MMLLIKFWQINIGKIKFRKDGVDDMYKWNFDKRVIQVGR